MLLTTVPCTLTPATPFTCGTPAHDASGDGVELAARLLVVVRLHGKPEEKGRREKEEKGKEEGKKKRMLEETG